MFFVGEKNGINPILTYVYKAGETPALGSN
jgi:hypothetical protein